MPCPYLLISFTISVLLQSAFTTEGNKTLVGVLTATFVTEKTMSCAKDSSSLVVLSVLLLSLSNDFPEISTVKKTSSRCGT